MKSMVGGKACSHEFDLGARSLGNGTWGSRRGSVRWVFSIFYYFLEDKAGKTIGYSGSYYFAFMPPDQQYNKQYSQYGVFWLYNWFQVGNGNMYIHF